MGEFLRTSVRYLKVVDVAFCVIVLVNSVIEEETGRCMCVLSVWGGVDERGR